MGAPHKTRLITALLASLLLFGCGKTDVVRSLGIDDGGAADTDIDSDTDADTDTDTGAEEINGDFLKAVFAVSSDAVFAVGSHGKIIHFDGVGWTWMESLVEELLSGVWGSAHDNVIAVGDGGTVIRFDGESWYQDDSTTSATLIDVWGVSANDVFAVGAGATIIRFDGDVWESMESGVVTSLRSVWGSSSSDVYAVGLPTEDGVVLHYDGATWSYLYDVPPHSGGTSEPLYLPQEAVWGTSASDVYVAGMNDWANSFEDCVGASIAHFDGSGWNEVFEHLCLSEYFNAMWGSSPEDIYAVNLYAQFHHFDGADWSELAYVSTDLHARVVDIHGSSATDIFAVGGYYYSSDSYWQPEIWRFDGAGWSAVFGPDE